MITPQMLAAQAQADLVLAAPTPAASPGLDRFQLVGLPSWFWVTPWAESSKTASIPGLSATVTARPTRSTWDFGAAGTLVCDGPGTPYDVTLPAAAQSTTCATTFTTSANITGRVSVEWQLSWTSSAGAGGQLPAVTRAATFPLDIHAAQAVTD